MKNNKKGWKVLAMGVLFLGVNAIGYADSWGDAVEGVSNIVEEVGDFAGGVLSFQRTADSESLSLPAMEAVDIGEMTINDPWMGSSRVTSIDDSIESADAAKIKEWVNNPYGQLTDEQKTSWANFCGSSSDDSFLPIGDAFSVEENFNNVFEIYWMDTGNMITNARDTYEQYKNPSDLKIVEFIAKALSNDGINTPTFYLTSSYRHDNNDWTKTVEIYKSPLQTTNFKISDNESINISLPVMATTW